MSWMDFNDTVQARETPLALSEHMEFVAQELLGNPNPRESTKTEWRYGNRGSLSIDLEKGVFSDHETGEGGGVLALIQRELGCNKAAAAEWLKDRVGLAPTPPKGKPKIVATYRYDDEAGNHLFDVIRFEPKDFRQRAPSGAWTVKDIRKALYRLPQLKAAPDGATVYLVEGEKDVHALEALGLLATTNPGGAGKWRDEYNDALSGKSVVVLPDNDQAGRDHAATVKASLGKAGISCTVLELEGLPPKGDVADWLAKGGRREDLEKLARDTPGHDAGQAGQKPKPKFELIRSDKLRFSEPEFLIDGLMETETLSLFFGDPGSGKSFAALGVGCCVATGQPFHGRAVKKGAVIYICGEGKNGIKRRLTAWEKHNGTSLAGRPLFVSRIAAQFLSPESINDLVEAIDAAAAEAGDVALIIIDTLNRNMGAGDENSAKDMTAFVSAVDMVKDRYSATALVVHHTGHGNKERARGSMSLLGALDAEYRVEKTGETTVIITNTKMKDAGPPPPIAFELTEVEVGRNRLGEAITSAVLVETDAPATPKRGLPASVRLAVATWFEAKRRSSHPGDHSQGVHVDDWRAVFYERSTADTQEAKKKAFQRDRQALVARGILGVTDDHYRLLNVPEGFSI